MSIYSQNILEHYKEPQNKGKLEPCDCEKGQVNRSCGDQIKVYLNFDGDKISEIKFEGEGCAISMAAASMLTEELVGLTKSEVTELGLEDVKELLGVEIGASRVKCALLALQTIQGCLSSKVLKAEGL